MKMHKVSMSRIIGVLSLLSLASISMRPVFATSNSLGSSSSSQQASILDDFAQMITNPIVVTILLSVATFALVFELFSPGFGVPGVIGLLFFGIFFYGHYVAGFAGYESVIMFVFGFILLIAELFVPGGIVGLIGGALVVLGLLIAGENMLYMAYSILIAFIIALIGMVVLMKFFGKKLHMFSKLVLTDATTTEEGYVSNANRTDLLGKVGKSLTPLRPAGTVVVEGERIDVVTEGGYIDTGKLVEIIKVEGSRIVVREQKEGDE